jgi:site-specific DNA-methyltransferase (adenine-specific)
LKHIIELKEGLEFLKTVESKSVDLVLTDPPYITSRETGMNKWVDHVNKQDSLNAKQAKTIEEWNSYKTPEEWVKFFENSKLKDKSRWPQELGKMKENYLKYGSIYGKKYAVKTDYGEWDSEFTLETLDKFISEFYRVLRKGGTAIIFFDLWKITNLKDMLEGNKFKQLRFIEWIKTNPQPLNSSRNYLTNCREIALMGVKGGSPTFNSKYDNAIYMHPLQGGKDRFHPTQKSLKLFEDLVNKHSNPGDLVLDPFSGSGTTAVASKMHGRNFIGCEIDQDYYNKSIDRLEKTKYNLQIEREAV